MRWRDGVKQASMPQQQHDKEWPARKPMSCNCDGLAPGALGAPKSLLRPRDLKGSQNQTRCCQEMRTCLSPLLGHHH